MRVTVHFTLSFISNFITEKLIISQIVTLRGWMKLLYLWAQILLRVWMCNMYLSHPPTLFRGVHLENENSPGLGITFFKHKI
jgi:hypothetical protein